MKEERPVIALVMLAVVGFIWAAHFCLPPQRPHARRISRLESINRSEPITLVVTNSILATNPQAPKQQH